MPPVEFVYCTFPLSPLVERGRSEESSQGIGTRYQRCSGQKMDTTQHDADDGHRPCSLCYPRQGCNGGLSPALERRLRPRRRRNRLFAGVLLPGRLPAQKLWGPAEKSVWDLMNVLESLGWLRIKRHYGKLYYYYYYIISAIVLQAPLGVASAIIIKQSSISIPSIRLHSVSKSSTAQLITTRGFPQPCRCRADSSHSQLSCKHETCPSSWSLWPKSTW